jgi:hypothetical protein
VRRAGSVATIASISLARLRARSAFERVDLDARVVGDRRDAERGRHLPRLRERVLPI